MKSVTEMTAEELKTEYDEAMGELVNNPNKSSGRRLWSAAGELLARLRELDAAKKWGEVNRYATGGSCRIGFGTELLSAMHSARDIQEKGGVT